MLPFEAQCQACGSYFVFRSVPGSSGYLLCSECCGVISIVNVSPWKDWIDSEVQRLQGLPDRADPRVNSEAASWGGIAAELAACLCQCPGFVDEWQARHKSLDKSNEGEDLLHAWIGYSKDFEIKWTPYYNEYDLGILYIRRPSGMLDLVPQRDVKDSIYVLFNGRQGHIYFGTCWAGPELFREQGILNPAKLGKGKPTFGNHHRFFHKFVTIADRLSFDPADIEIVSCKKA